jgi:hypothetical protein
VKVRFTRRAFRHMNAVLDYIEERSPQGGQIALAAPSCNAKTHAGL